MPNDPTEDPAAHLYADGKKYDWKQDKSPAAASLARANFQQAAAMGRRGAAWCTTSRRWQPARRARIEGKPWGLGPARDARQGRIDALHALGFNQRNPNCAGAFMNCNSTLVRTDANCRVEKRVIAQSRWAS